jgi:transposase
VAARQKKSRAGRRLLFFDESGLLMAPLVRRTWALRGRRPIIRQRGRHREKISVAAALWLSADGEPEGVSYRMIANGYFNNVAVASFLTDLLAEAKDGCTVVWDGGNMHRGQPIQNVLAAAKDRLELVRLPAYAPMLNPVEQLWNWLKYTRLCNYAPLELSDLHARAQRELKNVQRNRSRMRSFWHGCELAQGGH